MIISGFHAVESFFTNNLDCVIEVYVQSSRKDKRLHNSLKLITNKSIKIYELNKDKLDKLTKTYSHQGIAAKVILRNIYHDNELKIFLQKQKPQLILILDGITDPHNLGACLRSANAFAVDCVILTKDGTAEINEIVYKTSAGSINKVKIFQIVNLVRVIKLLQQNDIWVIGLDGNATDDINKQVFNTAHAIIVGSEGKGLRKLTKKHCDNLVKITMFGNVDSLNVSVATGIALFSARKWYNS